MSAGLCVLLALVGFDATGNYQNQLRLLSNPGPILADYPEYFEPIKEVTRYEAPAILNEEGADLSVRAWRFSYNARGIIEMPNRIRADKTAVILVHPWGIDDGQGWKTPEPAGVADFCTPTKNHLGARHTREVVNPFLKRLRDKAAMVMYSLPGKEDPIRHKLYRSFTHRPTEQERNEGAKELTAKLKNFEYRGQPLPATLSLSKDLPVRDYFKQFPGLDATARFNNTGFWDLPIPILKEVEVDPNDIVIYDGDGYPLLRKFLQKNGVKHVLLTGYNTDMCYCKTTAGYLNLSGDFNVFLVADASLATFPANTTPRYATNASISYAALEHLITQVSWVQYEPNRRAQR